jgi:tape measure domain-containing protein
VLPWLTSIGNTAAAMGGGKDVIDGITTALAQMSAKGKVSAEEMNQLAERGVPAWRILADAIGIGVPEAMKLAETGAINAAQAVPAILDGMNQRFGGSMAALSQTLTGQWSNFKDQITLALIPIGQALIPALQNLLQVMQPVLQSLADAAQWFGSLPQPVQNAALAFAALAAAIGPIVLIAGQMAVAISALMPVLTAIAGAIGVSVVALGGWAIAIAAVIAALVALGTWVYSNWDQIVAFLSGIWDSVEQKWTEVWTSIVGAVTGIWEWFKGLFGSYWEPIVNFLGGIWSTLTGIWKAEWDLITGAVVAVWKWFTGLAEQVFGPAIKFLGDVWSKLTGAWNDAGKAAEEAKKKTEDLSKATTDQTAAVKTNKTEVKNLGTELGITKGKTTSAKTAMTDLGKEVETTGDKHKTAKVSVQKFNDEILLEKLRQAQTEHNKLVREIAAYEITLEKAAGKAFDLNAEWEKLTATTNLGAAAIGSINVKLPVMNSDMDTAIARTQALDGAFKTLGVTSSIEFAKVAADAAHARDIVLGSDQASDFDKKTAVYKALKAQIDAAKAAGTEIPAEQAAMLEKLKTELETKVPEMKAPFEGLATSVSTVITNFAQDISKSLWDGEMSWGEKGKSLLKSLGEAVTSSFIEPATAAIGSFIKGALADLLGGGGFGGIWDSLKGMGSAIGGIFGGGGAKPSVPSVPTGGGGAGGGLGGIMGGAGGWISGIGSAVGGALSLIGSMRTEGTLNAIEKEVRYSQIHLFYILGDLNDFFHRDWWVLYGLVLDIKSAIVDSMEPQLARAAGHIDVLKQIAENDLKVSLGAIASYTLDILTDVDHASRVLDQILLQGVAANERLDKMIATSERIAATSQQSVSMNLYGTDPEVVAARIAQQLRLQGASG